MNNKTLLTIGLVAGAAAVGWYIYQKRKQTVTTQTPTAGNATGSTAATIEAASDALNGLADRLGL